MKKWIWTFLAAAIGFLMPIWWGILGFANFTAPNSPWTDRYWKIVNPTCPLWDAPGTMLTPFLNAAVYAALPFISTILITKLKRAGRTE